jgi:hypothetical protein
LSRPIVIERFDELTDAEHVSQQQEFISVRNVRHPAHEVPGELPFLIRQVRLPDICVQLPDQCENKRSAYRLVYLHRYRGQIISRCVDDAADAAKRGQIYRYPGWETALGWFQRTRGGGDGGRYWLIPPVLWRKLDAEFRFDYDPCPCPLPKGFNGLAADWCNWVNPPFSKDDVIGGKGATAFVRKAIAEQKKGKTSVIVLPVFEYVTRLLEAGAEIRPLGRVPFLDVDSRRAASHPPNIAVFILRPS